jgi:hypothetical protein
MMPLLVPSKGGRAHYRKRREELHAPSMAGAVLPRQKFFQKSTLIVSIWPIVVRRPSEGEEELPAKQTT